MVGQDCDQLVFVFRLQQVFDSAGGKGCKGGVGWGEDGEGASALQGIDQTSGGQRSGKCGSLEGLHSDWAVVGLFTTHQRRS